MNFDGRPHERVDGKRQKHAPPDDGHPESCVTEPKRDAVNGRRRKQTENTIGRSGTEPRKEPAP